MNANLRLAVVFIIGWLAQGVLVPEIAIGSVQPDFILIVVCAYAVYNGPARGAVGGLVCGLIQDLLVPANLGLGSAVKAMAGYVAGGAENPLAGDGPLVPGVLIAGLSAVSQTLYLGLLLLSGEPLVFIDSVVFTVLPSAGYTALVGVAVFPVLRNVFGAEKDTTIIIGTAGSAGAP